MTNTLKETAHVVQGKDGVYRWVYEVPMLKNLSILFTVWKVLGISACAPGSAGRDALGRKNPPKRELQALSPYGFFLSGEEHDEQVA